MEYTQWAPAETGMDPDDDVLILVVMEYTQWEIIWFKRSFNLCLNPCCNGIYSMRFIQVTTTKNLEVLILVVMEYTQWALNHVHHKRIKKS